MTTEELARAYKGFLASDAGKHFMEQAFGVLDRNVNMAMDTNSLDYLSRSKGNREIIDLLDNVIKTEVIETD